MKINSENKGPTPEQLEEIFADDAESALEVAQMTREERVELEQSAYGLSRGLHPVG